jgi:hypothetical protein
MIPDLQLAGGRVEGCVVAETCRVPEVGTIKRRNVGAEAVTTEWLLFVDSDCRPEPSILDDYFVESIPSECGVVAGSIVAMRLGEEAVVRERLTLDHLARFAEASRSVLVDRDVIGYAVSLADATRNPAEYGLGDIASYIEYGASPRGPIGMVQAARALALLRGRGHVTSGDVRDLAADVLRHRLVLSYDALSDGVTADDLLDRVLAEVTEPEADHVKRSQRRVAAA